MIFVLRVKIHAVYIGSIIKIMMRVNQLAAVSSPDIRPIFKDLTNGNLLNRCLLGLTQNQNEALTGVLWSKCPK